MLGVSLLYICGLSLKRQPNVLFLGMLTINFRRQSCGLFLLACAYKLVYKISQPREYCHVVRILKNKNQLQESVKCVIVVGMLSV